MKSTIERLKENAAARPDGVPNKLLKETVDQIKLPLSILFRQSLQQEMIPDEWREASITPIFKKGKSEPGNYRPVALTSAVCKVMERIVKEGIEKHIEENGLTGNSQHGFRHGRSPQTNLIEFMDQTRKWIDNGRAFNIVYMDFTKAFDKVCHASLAVKLKANGLEGKLLGWIKNWLYRRRQRVVVDGEWSDVEEVLSSVIQGSVLVGTFFNMFINDLDERIIAFLRKFADDTKMARLVENEDDASELQKDIDALHA